MVLAKLEVICSKIKLNLYLSPCTKLNSKWIKDIGIRPETLHLIEDKLRPSLHHVGLGSDFLNKTSKAQEIKARINKWDEFKLKSIFSAKETINNAKRESRVGENLYHMHFRQH